MQRLIAILLALGLVVTPLATASDPHPQAPPPKRVAAAAKPKKHRKAARPAPHREKRPPTVIICTLTAYTGTDAGMRGDDITASGARATPWVTVAAWRDIPFGSRIEVPALHRTFIVQDRGGAIGYGKLDVYVGHDDKAAAYEFGRKRLEVRIYPAK